MGLGDTRHIERGKMHARQTDGTVTAGQKWEGGKAAGGDEGRLDREREFFPVVGDVCPYIGAYQGGVGGQRGFGENGRVRHI